MIPNVFLISPRLGEEDRLTAFWEWVLDAVPGLGQKFVDHITIRSGLSATKFLGAIQHPTLNTKNRPDFVIKCNNIDIFFEHKLEASFGPNQLHRYLKLLLPEHQYLAVLAAQRMVVPSEVYSSPQFVYPKEVGATTHFLWQDVHQIVRSFRNRIAKDFSRYLEHLGLVRFVWPGLGNPFTDIKAAESLRSLYGELTPNFKRPGVICRTRANSLIYEIQKPIQNIYLINIGPIQSVSLFDPKIWGPVMAAWVWVRGTAGRSEPLLPIVYGWLENTEPLVLGSSTLDAYSGEPEIFQERIYYTPLNQILVGSRETSKQRLLSFSASVIAHLRGELRMIPHDEA